MIWAAALGGSGLGVAPEISARAVRHSRDAGGVGAGGAASASSHPFGWASDESVMAGSLYLHDAAVGAALPGKETQWKVVTAPPRQTLVTAGGLQRSARNSHLRCASRWSFENPRTTIQRVYTGPAYGASAAGSDDFPACGSSLT
jgi:hypothetical protein